MDYRIVQTKSNKRPYCKARELKEEIRLEERVVLVGIDSLLVCNCFNCNASASVFEVIAQPKTWLFGSSALVL